MPTDCSAFLFSSRLEILDLSRWCLTNINKRSQAEFPPAFTTADVGRVGGVAPAQALGSSPAQSLSPAHLAAWAAKLVFTLWMGDSSGSSHSSLS